MEFYRVFNSITVHPHHIKQNVCGSRAKYRDGRRETAVKVYTVNQESIYLLITNVPAIGGGEELRALCDQYGIVDEFQPLDDYPCEEFTEAYLVKYRLFPAARHAKKYLDDKSFLGGILHVFYAPEFESVLETKLKLQERRKYVAWKNRTGSDAVSSKNLSQQNRLDIKKSSLVSPASSSDGSVQQPVTYVWAGKEYTVYPKASQSETDAVVAKTASQKTSSGIFLPRQLKQKPASEQSYVGFSGTTKQIQEDSRLASHSKMPHIDESSYLSTISHVRSKVSSVSVPNVRVSLKRKRRV